MASKREQNIGIVALLNIVFTIVEIIGALLTNSLAILADALHDLGDSAVLITAWIFERASNKKPDLKRTYGYQRLSLISAIFAGVILIFGSLFIFYKAVIRLSMPEEVNASGMIIIATLGIFFNTLGFIKIKLGKSMNEKILSWHLLEDIFGWIVILVGAISIQLFSLSIIDPIMTIGFCIFVIVGAFRNLKESFNIVLQGVPSEIDVKNIKNALQSIKGVKDVHDMHIWTLEGETNILTAHVVGAKSLLKNPNKARNAIKQKLMKNNIQHSTIELESEKCCSGGECNNNC